MNPFHIPFVVGYHLWIAYWNTPWQFKVLTGIASLVFFISDSLKEEGPVRIAALFRRFSWAGIPLGIFIAWWLWMASYPEITGRSLVYSHWAYCVTLLGSLAIWYWAFVIFRGHHDAAILRRAYRRIRFRLRWDSIAKSAGLSHIRDIRPAKWITGGTRSTIGSDRVQWVPTLWHGRRIRMGNGVEYMFRPARGLDNERTLRALDAIAISANAHSATLAELPPTNWVQNWWKLTLYWTDPATVRPTLGWNLENDDSLDNGGDSLIDTPSSDRGNPDLEFGEDEEEQAA